MVRFIVAMFVFLATSVAQAQPGTALPMTQSSPSTLHHPDEVSETTALELSLGGTLASYGAIGLAIALRGNGAAGYIGTAGMIGTLIAPTFGHWYAGAIVTRGMGLRAGGLVVFVIGALADNEGCSLVYGDPQSEPADCGDDFRTKKGTALMFTGIAMFVGGTVDDIVTAPRRARRRNDTLRASLAVAPYVHRDSGGLVLTGRV
jgi:hypothetical protein